MKRATRSLANYNSAAAPCPPNALLATLPHRRYAGPSNALVLVVAADRDSGGCKTLVVLRAGSLAGGQCVIGGVGCGIAGVRRRSTRWQIAAAASTTTIVSRSRRCISETRAMRAVASSGGSPSTPAGPPARPTTARCSTPPASTTAARTNRPRGSDRLEVVKPRLARSLQARVTPTGDSRTRHEPVTRVAVHTPRVRAASGSGSTGQRQHARFLQSRA